VHRIAFRRITRAAESGGGGDFPPAFVEPSNFTLELVYPREVGTAPVGSGNMIPTGGNTNFPSTHRTNKAYPGIPLDIAAFAMGGSLPYRWSLTGAPSGMAIDQDTGRITWSNPTTSGSPFSITVAVEDAEETVASSTWTLTVTTTGFYFIDAAATPGGNTGTLADPFANIEEVYDAGIASSGILYFRAGTYTPSGVDAAHIETGGGVGGNDELDASGKPNIWIAYPGETVVYDALYGSIGTANAGIGCAWGDDTYVDGIRFTNVKNKMHTVYGGNYKVFKDCPIDEIQDAVGGSNPAGIECEAHISTYDYYLHIVRCDFSQHTNCGPIKLYSQRKWVMERCTTDGTTDVGCDPKARIPRFEFRYNHFIGANLTAQNDRATIYGNFAPGDEGIQGEVRFNYCQNPDVNDALVEFGADADTVYVYRNTFYGRPWSRWVTPNGSSPILHAWYRNVVINPDSTLPGRVSITGVDSYEPTSGPSTVEYTNVTVDDHLAGGTGDGIINTTTGELQGSYLTSYGPTTATPRGCDPAMLP
jgi:hypothetical protein